MEIKDARIDGGKPFDWGRTAADYARYRDIYPPEFYRAILDRGVGLAGQQVLDIAPAPGYCPAICISTALTGWGWIRPRSRLQRHGDCQPV